MGRNKSQDGIGSPIAQIRVSIILSIICVHDLVLLQFSMYQVKSLHIIGGKIHNVTNRDLSNSHLTQRKYLTDRKHQAQQSDPEEVTCVS